MINQWRCVGYTDDGCSEYQCLLCYGSWESREAPGTTYTCKKVYGSKKGATHWRDTGGLYHYEAAEPEYEAHWKFCPRCGTKWEGPRSMDPDNERALGPRRLRIQEALRGYRAPVQGTWTVEEDSGRDRCGNVYWVKYGLVEASAMKAHAKLKWLREHYDPEFRIKELL